MGGKPRQPLELPEVQRRFDGRAEDADNWFSVAAWPDGRVQEGVPDYVLEITPRAEYVNTHLMDECNRLRFIYNFERREDRLFLFSRVEYTYPDRPGYMIPPASSIIERVSFKPDGYMRRRLNDKSQPSVEEWEYRDMDLADNWEVVPEFGSWGHLGRYRG